MLTLKVMQFFYYLEKKKWWWEQNFGELILPDGTEWPKDQERTLASLGCKITIPKRQCSVNLP